MTAGDIVEKLPAKQAKSAEKSNSASERLADHLSDENYIEQQDQQLRDIEQEASDLSDTYAWIRPMRRDGNCFYRAALAAQVERIVRDPDELRRFDAVCKGWKDRLLRLGFQEMTTTDSAMCVIFQTRRPGYLKEHADEYAPFIDNGLPLEQYCAQEIETMWRDVDHLAIQGLVSGLGEGLNW
ncbi:unnamed protein product, partial [Mesorhabditis spiculigera]